MDPVSRVQIMEDPVWISHSTDTLKKSMSLTLRSQVMVI